jgi:hypothetical protein
MPAACPESVRIACRELLGSAISSIAWSSGRVGEVWAVHLVDGRQCIIKSRPDQEGLIERLEAVAHVQTELSHAGVPIPTPVAPPVAVEDKIVTFESVLSAHAASLSRKEAGDASLSTLIRILEIGEQLKAQTAMRATAAWVDSNLHGRGGTLWPEPHDIGLFGPSFDGAATDITQLARAASAFLADCWDRSDRVLGHDDWEAQNLVFGRPGGRPRVVAIFHTDSLAWMPEPVLAGSSAMQHGRGLPGSPGAPTMTEVDDWLAGFAARRGGRPTSWFRSAWAAASWNLAYNARCDELTGHDGRDSHRDACRQQGTLYLGRFGD